jgi:hypothetical protein
MGYNTLTYRKFVFLLVILFCTGSKGYAQTYYYIQQVGYYIAESSVLPVIIVNSDSNIVYQEATGVEFSVDSKCFDELDSLINICGDKLNYITDTIFNNDVFKCCNESFPTGSYQIIKYVDGIPISGKLIKGADDMKLFLCYLNNEIRAGSKCEEIITYLREDLELILYRMMNYKK